MTKEEKIKEAWGEYWGKLHNTAKKCALENNGYISGILANELHQPFTEWNTDIKAWRPKSLQGIENNNGWQKIESEADLPYNTKDANKAYKVLCKQIQFPDSLITAIWGCTELHKKKWLKDFSHYKEVEIEKPPIY